MRVQAFRSCGVLRYSKYPVIQACGGVCDSAQHNSLYIHSSYCNIRCTFLLNCFGTAFSSDEDGDDSVDDSIHGNVENNVRLEAVSSFERKDNGAALVDSVG